MPQGTWYLGPGGGCGRGIAFSHKQFWGRGWGPFPHAACAVCPSAALPKAVIGLQPPWVNLLQEDNVTLSCQGPHAPGNSPTRWFHNGNPIPAQVQPSYRLQVSSNDSGDYSCQTDQTSLSDPVHLDVVSGQWSKAPGGVGGEERCHLLTWPGFQGRGGRLLGSTAVSCLKWSFPFSPPHLFLRGVGWQCLGVCWAVLPQSSLSKKVVTRPQTGCRV